MDTYVVEYTCIAVDDQQRDKAENNRKFQQQKIENC